MKFKKKTYIGGVDTYPMQSVSTIFNLKVQWRTPPKRRSAALVQNKFMWGHPKLERGCVKIKLRRDPTLKIEHV